MLLGNLMDIYTIGRTNDRRMSFEKLSPNKCRERKNARDLMVFYMLLYVVSTNSFFLKFSSTRHTHYIPCSIPFLDRTQNHWQPGGRALTTNCASDLSLEFSCRSSYRHKRQKYTPHRPLLCWPFRFFFCTLFPFSCYGFSCSVSTLDFETCNSLKQQPQQQQVKKERKKTNELDQRALLAQRQRPFERRTTWWW